MQSRTFVQLVLYFAFDTN